MAFSDGDFLRIEYNAWRIADDKLVYTTSEKLAKENGTYSEETHYKPQLLVLGKGNSIKGVENAVRGMSLNETKKVEMEPKDAFGDKDPALVKVLPVADFRSRDIEPRPGMRLDIDGAIAYVKSVNSGRVVVDTNHPLAGERLRYEIKVVEKIDRDEDRVRAIADVFSLAPDSLAISGNVVKIAFGGKVEKDAKFLVNKSDFVSSVLRYMDKVTKVEVEEEYERKQEEEK